MMVPGDRRADSDKIAKAVGCGDVKVASASEVADATGFSAGGVAPFPLVGVDLVLMGEPCWRMRSSGSGQEPAMAALAPPTSSNWLQAIVDAVAEST